MSKETEKIFTIEKDEFSRLVRWAGKLTVRSSDHALLLIEVADGTIVLSSFDGINMAKAKGDVTQKFEGKAKFSVNGAMLMAIVKNIKDKELTCILDDATFTIKTPKARLWLPITGEGTRAKLPTLPPAIGKIDTKEFKTLMTHAINTASDDPSMMAITVVNIRFSPQNQKMTLSSTDRYRLVVRELPYKPSPDTASSEDFVLNVDAKNFKIMISDVSEDSDLTLYANIPSSDGNGDDQQHAGQFGISTATEIGTVLLTDVEFAKIAGLLKRDKAHRAVFKRAELVAMLNQTKPLVKDVSKKGTFTFSMDTLQLKTESTEMEIDTVSSNFEEDMDIFINMDYLSAMLGNGKSEYVGFSTDGQTKPMTIDEMIDDKTIDMDYYSIVMVMAR